MNISLKTIFFKFCGVVLVTTLTACGSSHHDAPLNPEGQKSEGQGEKALGDLLAEPEQIVFKDVQKFVLEPSCVECHNSKNEKRADVDLTTYEALFGKSSKASVIPFNPLGSLIYETLLVSKGSRHMPPFDKPQLSEEQKNLVFQWVKNGAKEEVAQQVPRPKSLSEELQPYFDDPKVIDYALVKKYVFDNSCTKCHSTQGSDPDQDAILYGQNMTTYKDLLFNSGIVKNILSDKIVSDGNGGKKKLKGSRIYKSVAIQQSMPPQKDGYKPMDSLRIKLLRLWIINCAIEDYASITNDTLFDKMKSSGKIRDCVEPEENL